MQGTNLRTEPKHIVFLSQLLLLFGFCHSCKHDNPMVDVHQVGTEAVVTTNCSNLKCPKPRHVWHSQPMIPGTKLPAGNLLLCMAILLAGGSASKVLTIFSHMGLGCISLNTFFKYQRVGKFNPPPPTIRKQLSLIDFFAIFVVGQAISNNSAFLADLPEKDAGQGEKHHRGNRHSR